jgi:uncharacterized protein (TIGR02466 family)
MEIIDLFSTPLFYTKCNFDLDNIESDCIAKKIQDPNGVQLSNITGWQSQNILLDDGLSNLKFLIKEIENISREYVKALSLTSNVSAVASWININPPGAFNQRHDHPLCLVSGVFYVKAPKDCGNIEFVHPSSAKMNRDWVDKQVRYAPCNSPAWSVEPEENMLYIFPGWLEHTVYPNKSKEDRISISFNISES